ncbi:MAG: hypothetical protein ACOY0T_16955 [Myxococcota bacterium]
MSQAWGQLKRGLAGIVVATPLLSSTEAKAQMVASAGAFVGVSFGERVRFEWGAEVMALAMSGPSCSQPRVGAGPFFQVDVLGITRPRVSLGLAGGAPFESAAVGGELGLSIFVNPRHPLDLYTALRFNADHVNVFAHQNWFQFEHAYGAGIVTAPFVRDWCSQGRHVVEGRALRDAGGAARSVASHRSCHDLGAMARRWESDAREEYASIGAFIQLAHELAYAGAPRQIVARALAAANEEIDHAELCLSLAAQFARRPLEFEGAPLALRQPLQGIAALERLAAESALDGWLGEGQAALRAQNRGLVAADVASSRVHRRIAKEEASHAALGADVVRWAIASGGRAVRDAVRRSLAHCFDHIAEPSDGADPKPLASELAQRERARREILMQV